MVTGELGPDGARSAVPGQKAWGQVGGRDAGQAVMLDASGQVFRGRQDGRDVQAVGMRPVGLIAVAADMLGAAAEQGDGAAGVAPAGVRQADRDLGQALPQVAFVRRAGLPGRLEDLVRVERAAVAEQPVGEDGGVAAGNDEIVGDPVLAGIVVLAGLALLADVTGQRASQAVAGACVPGPAGWVTIPGLAASGLAVSGLTVPGHR